MRRNARTASEEATQDLFVPISGSSVVALRHDAHHLMPFLMLQYAHSQPSATGDPVRTTINIDDDLLSKASRMSGLTERTLLIHEGLQALIERESARRLARLGGSQKTLKAPPRRRNEA